MPLVYIVDTCLEVSGHLAGLLGRRRVSTEVGSAPQSACTVLVAADSKGPKVADDMLNIARKAKAQRVILVDDTAEVFSLHEELGGRVVRVGLPKMQNPHQATRDIPLLYLADIVCSGLQSMVALDHTTGTLMDLSSRVAKTDVTVFINGPTGSGKEVLARQIHLASRRSTAPFIAVNCAAIPENMLEAILFGHEKGAFTGANVANKGIIRAADKGTLLLDEISEMPISLQSKLLRVLQERKITPIGSHEEVPVDIRVIATSNRDMPTEVVNGRFREDRYYRLNVFPLSTRALKSRPDDIPALAASLARRHTPEGGDMPMFSAGAISALCSHDWPGNVRELENVIQRAIVLHSDGIIADQDIIIDAGTCLSGTPLAQAV